MTDTKPRDPRAGFQATLVRDVPDHITIAVVTYNGRALIGECLSAIRALRGITFDLVVIDNRSTDGTPDLVRAAFPEADVILMPANNGPNPARNAGLRYGPNRFVLLIDDDVVLEPDAALHLVEAMRSDPRVALTTGRTVYYDRPDTVQYSWMEPHFLGEAIFQNGERKLAECSPEQRIVPVCTSTYMLIDREQATYIGGFDEYYFFGKTDTDFTIRLTMAGFDIVEHPQAVARHRVKLRGFRNVRRLVRNRLYLMVKVYSLRTWLVILPVFVVDELLRMAFLTLNGQFMPWLRGMLDITRDLPKALRARGPAQALRMRRDSAVLAAGDMVMRPDIVRHAAVARLKEAYCALTTRYWLLVQRLV